MLYNLKWLDAGMPFPPVCEADRIQRYQQNAAIFDGDHFADPGFRTHDGTVTPGVNVYLECAKRISSVVGNFEDVISFPVLLNYQRLMSLKMADLVCGEYPTISGATPGENEAIRNVRDESDFDAKCYSTVIDMSRFGDAIWRLYKDWNGRYNFTCWDPTQWFPIVAQDGTNSIAAHCLCWTENVSDDADKPEWKLHVQIHSCKPDELGYYEHRVYKMNTAGNIIMDLESAEKVVTGVKICAVMHLKAFSTTNSIYGYDDYMPIDSLLAEIMVRVGQISRILDKHADPNITGPITMLEQDPKTGEYHLRTGKFFAVSQGEDHPEYMTWDGQLTSAFSQLELLLNQLYILSEMGAALLGSQDGSSQAISGTAMRFKMVNPLAKARRIANSLTRPVRQLFSSMSVSAEVDSTDVEEPDLPIPYKHISVMWADGLPDDPRENVEICKLATGMNKLMPLEKAIMEYFSKSNEEAKQWIKQIKEETELFNPVQPTDEDASDDSNVNHAGPQDGTGVNPMKKGSTTGLNDFHSETNGGDA